MSVSLSELSIEQLGSIKEQIDQELLHLSNSYSSLKTALNKFNNCMISLNEIKPINADKTILIPLSNSLYVSGKVYDSSNVLVDIGTGYFIEQSTTQAKVIYNQKILTIKSNLIKLQSTIEQKDNNLQSIINSMKLKFKQKDEELAAQRAAQN